MRQLLLISILLVHPLNKCLAETEDHTSEKTAAEKTVGRPKLSVQERLQRFVSACSNGRITLPAGAASAVGSGPQPPLAGDESTGSTPNSSSSSSTASSEGERIFQSRCLVCHSGTPQGPIKNFSDAVVKVESGAMPKLTNATVALSDAQKKPLTPEEKASLIAFLKTRP